MCPGGKEDEEETVSPGCGMLVDFSLVIDILGRVTHKAVYSQTQKRTECPRLCAKKLLINNFIELLETHNALRHIASEKSAPNTNRTVS